MIVSKSVRIDLNRPKKTVIHISQDDNTREVVVFLYRDGAPYDVTADLEPNTTVVMSARFILPNGYSDDYTETDSGEAAVVQDGTIKNKYSVRIDGVATIMVGFTDILVRFSTEAGAILHSFPLTLDVIRSRGSDVDPDGNPPENSKYVRADLQVAATEDMTADVGFDSATGKLKVAPGGGGGGGSVTPASIVTATGQMTATQKTNTRTNIGAAPSTNIAKTALASEVQTSLEHADKSVRFDMTQGLTDAQKSTARSNIGAGTGSYSKPSGGIPASDLASAVQTSLGKADTALQSVGAEDILGAAEDFTAAQQGVMRGYIGAASTDALTAYVPKSAQGAKTVNDTQEVHIDGNGKLWTQPGGGGDTPIVVENTQLITMTYAAGDTYASMTAAQIYAALQDGAVNFVLIDRSGRECALDYPPEDETDVAKFYAYSDDDTDIIVYTINASGTVTSSTRHVGTYDKPGGGIPQTDLASTLSDKINGALQTGNLAAKTSAMTQAVGYDSTTGKLFTAPGSGGGGVYKTLVTISYDDGSYVSDLSPAEIYNSFMAGDVIEVDCNGIKGSLLFCSATSAEALSFSVSGNNNLLETWSIGANGAVTYNTALIGNVNTPSTQTYTATQLAQGVAVYGNYIYTVSGSATGFKITTANLPDMQPGQCIEIRLTTGSTAITTPTWPAWCKLMGGWDGTFEANTYYDIVIDDAGNVYAGTREVTA